MPSLEFAMNYFSEIMTKVYSPNKKLAYIELVVIIV